MIKHLILIAIVASFTRLTVEIIEEMRDWAMCCAWRDEDEIAEMSDIQIVLGVSRHYDGGIPAFHLAM